MVATPPTTSAVLLMRRQSAHGRSDTQPVATRVNVFGDADDGEQEGRLLVRYAQSDGVVREIDERHEETYDDMKTLATVMVIAVVRLHAGTTACGEWDKCMW